MHQIHIHDKGKTVYLPASWEDCTPSQLNYILPLSFLVVSGHMDVHEFTVRVFSRFTGLKQGPNSYFMRKLRPLQAQNVSAMISQLSEQLCSWPFQELTSPDSDEVQLELALNTPVNLLPVIEVGGSKLFGPADLISDLTFSEFRVAVREMEQHISFSKDPDLQTDAMVALDRFISVLYRMADPQTGKKKKFTPDSVSEHQSIVSKIPLWKKNTILLWFSYCINYIQSEDVVIDGHTINLSVLFPKSTGSAATEKKGIGWAGLLFDVSKEGPFGHVDKTDKVGLFDILLYLYKNHQDNVKLQKRLKSKK